jgi:predicted transcriptional regulator with HTH domain
LFHNKKLHHRLLFLICKIKKYIYLCTPIKRRVQNDKDNFS